MAGRGHPLGTPAKELRFEHTASWRGPINVMTWSDKRHGRDRPTSWPGSTNVMARPVRATRRRIPVLAMFHCFNVVVPLVRIMRISGIGERFAFGQAITLACRNAASLAVSNSSNCPRISSVCWPGVGTGPTRPGVADIFTVTPGA
jgi:hypothetical protein